MKKFRMLVWLLVGTMPLFAQQQTDKAVSPAFQVQADRFADLLY